MVTIVTSAAALLRIPPTPKELAHKQGCYIKEINDVIPYNSNVTILGICELRRCSKDYIYRETCGIRSVPGHPECFLTNKDYSRPYSECCQQVYCDIGENFFAE
ncbi:hypothetical protein O0L34_g13783 [Tuta absoluta]|nr:hypothetical protein O0L34_g13783 [Tuta absoluta]